MLYRLLTAAFLLCAIAASADTDPQYYNLMGDADKAIADGKFSEAEDLLRKAMRLEPANPSNVLLMSNLGMVQFYDGRTADALATLSTAHSIAPNSVTVLQNRARIYAAEGQWDKALGDYSRVIELDSTLVEPRFYHAMLALRTGDIPKASAEIADLMKMAPDHRLTHEAQAIVLMQSGLYKEAIPHLSAVIKAAEDASYYSSRAYCRLLTDDLAGASDDIPRGLELDPTDGELYLYRAMLNKLRYRPDDAKADAAEAVKWGIDPARVKSILE